MNKRKTTDGDSAQLNVRFTCSTQIGLSNCPECRRPAGMLRPEEAAAVAEVNMRTIYRWVEVKKVHFVETAEGSVLVCLNSLSRELPNRDKNRVSLP